MLRGLATVGSRFLRSVKVEHDGLRCLGAAEGVGARPALVPPCAASCLSSVSEAVASKATQTFAARPATEGSTSPNPGVYRLDIVTGDVRGAGTQSPAVVRLIGEEGETGQYSVGDDQEAPGFQHGTTQSYEVDVDQDLGRLKRVFLRQAQACASDTGVGWYLDRVEITAPDGQQWSFPCGAWLGKSDAGDFEGEQERNLIACDPDEPIVSEYLAEPLEVNASAVAVPHPEKVQQGSRAVNKRGQGYGGEDAYFYAWGPNNAVFALGVADGVYMWRTQGIDSGVFSRHLMQVAKQAVEAGAVDVVGILEDGHASIQENGIKGSSTCCIVVIDTLQGRATCASIGDSGFVLLGGHPGRREMHVKYRSPQQEHQFGYPYQLGHQESSDHPNSAMLTNLPVFPGDLLILGSDGLFDNVSDDEILEEVRKQLDSGGKPNAIAHHLASIAFYNSIDKEKVTPYSLGATEAFDMVYNGGKADDITVVVAQLIGEPIEANLVKGMGRHGL